MKLKFRKATTHQIPKDLMPLFTGEDGAFYPDTWWYSFHAFFPPLVALVARKMREAGHGHPGDTTHEEWHTYLKGIEEDLREYINSGMDDKAKYEKAQEAMRRFVDRMGDWWD